MDTTSKVLFGAGLLLATLVGVTLFAVLLAAPGLGRATTTVVVARQAIPDRTAFTATNLAELTTTRQLPSDAVPAGALLDPSELLAKTTLRPLAAGEVILATPDRLIGGPGGLTRPAVAIPRDQVALAVSASEVLAVAGALQPDDRVDVIASWPRSDGQIITQNVLPDVRVFAVGRWQGDGRERAAAGSGGASPATSTVTLLLDLQQAVILEHLLSTGGRVVLALRRFDQGGELRTEAVTTDGLTRRYGGPESP